MSLKLPPPFFAPLRLCVSLFLALAAFAFSRQLWASPEIPGANQDHPIALVGGVIHPIRGPEMRDGVLLFDKGKIVAVGKDVKLPVGTEKIDLKGKHVYPGLIDAHTPVGLVEVPSVRGSVDEIEVGRVNPSARSLVAVNPDSELIPVTRSNGVLVALSAPGGGLISGSSSVIQLDGWTWEDMCVRPDVGLHIVWPRMAPIHTWRGEETAEHQLSDRDKALRELRETFHDARAYWTNKKARAEQKAAPPERDARWEALVPVLEGKRPVIIQADEIQQIQSAVAWARHEGVKMILLGGYDAPHCAELLKKYDVPVIVGGVTRLPQRRDDPYDAPFTVAAELHEAGIRYCICGAGRMGNVRNLPYHAAMAAAFGLPVDEALRAITLYPAEMLGVADRLGSLEAGKDATLIVTTGNPLEIPTQVTDAFIQGRRVDLSDRQKRLWKKYEEKYRRLEHGK
jgi:imidazolonepropionase-like amidohydrolase